MRTTSSTDPREDPMSSGTGSPSAGRTTTGFTRAAGRRGARDSTRSLVGLLRAMVLHPFGRHDYVDVVDWDKQTVTLVCWRCEDDADPRPAPLQ
jgi:hypothetical protein